MINIEIQEYDELVNLQDNLKKVYCENCGIETWHLYVGWKGVTRCLKCEREK